MNLIEELRKKINNDNYKIVEELGQIIIDLKINSLEDLRKQEDYLFTYNGNVLNNQERINYCLELIKYLNEDYELLSFKDIQKYKQLKLELSNNISIEDKIKNLVILFNMTNRDMLFLTETYHFIINGEL